MRKILNIGEIPNDGKGDKLRHAFDLSQQNFVEIYKFFGDGQNITSLSVRQKLDTPTNAEVDTKIVNAATLSGTHMRNVSNPHNVTKEQIGLSNVDNTSDANKPISTEIQKALNLKANLNTTQQALNLKANLDATKKVPITELHEASTTQKGITQLVNDLNSGGIDKAITAEVVKQFKNAFKSSRSQNGHIEIPCADGVPLIIQWGRGVIPANGAVFNGVLSVVFPISVLAWTGSVANNVAPTIFLDTLVTNRAFVFRSDKVLGAGAIACAFFAVGY